MGPCDSRQNFLDWDGGFQEVTYGGGEENGVVTTCKQPSLTNFETQIEAPKAEETMFTEGWLKIDGAV